MWFVEQFDSFINLGICKEYPNMARAKSTPGSKTTRTNPNNEQTTGSPAGAPEVKAAAAAGNTPAEAVAATVKPAPEVRKLEMVKTEPRKNVIPINLEDEIRRRAYELYVQRGSRSGSEAEDWLTAEREVRQRYQKQQSA
jgi:hypothetical protein